MIFLVRSFFSVINGIFSCIINMQGCYRVFDNSTAVHEDIPKCMLSDCPADGYYRFESYRLALVTQSIRGGFIFKTAQRQKQSVKLFFKTVIIVLRILSY